LLQLQRAQLHTAILSLDKVARRNRRFGVGRTRGRSAVVTRRLSCLFVVLFEQQQQPQQQQQHQQLTTHGGCSQLEPGGDAPNTSYDSDVIAPTLPTAVLPRRGRRQAVYDPKVC